jgi:mono/diheme cytochrome c family protein
MTDSPRRPSLPLAGWLFTIAWASASIADEPANRPIVPGFERFYAAPNTDRSTGGRLLIGELNCTSCHRGDDAPLSPVSRKQAPILDRVGARAKVEHLRAFLADPHAVKPGTTMPNLLAGLTRAEADPIVESLVHLLASTGSVKETAPDRRAISRGQILFEQVGCVACHGPPGDKSASMSTSVPIGEVGSKYAVDSLAAFVQDPLSTRPSGRMPSLNLKGPEAQAIASYLLKDVRVEVPPHLAYRYYEGEWDNVPDFDKLTPSASGVAEGFDVEVARRNGNYAIRFEGTLLVDRPGPYTFHLASDDGSKLSVDGKLVVDNDGIHPNQREAGRVRLDRGRHKVVVGYFQGGGEDELEVEYEGPGLPQRPLAPAIAPLEGASPPKATAESRFVPDPSKVERGRALFASIGCASCHQLREGDRAIEPRPSARPLGELRADSGCLAAEPPRGVPDYDLSPHQRAAMGAALKPEPGKPGDRDAISRTLLAFNCYSCHVRDGVGGVEEGRNPLFATTQKEMGDEGRLPPLLTGVGAKLTEAWLKHVLADGAKDRPYMLTRMPKFGDSNVEHLVKPLGVVDQVEPVPVPHFEVSGRRVKATGRFIVGSQAFNCGSCHQFKEYQAAGIQAMDMTLMTRRLRRDWFHRYVVDPPAFRPGTRMPTAWPGGKSQLESIYDGDTLRQVESVWVYLSDGPNAAIPYGLGRDPIPLAADKGAVLYRNFIQGAGPRAIGVGYPEKANLAFDANDLRLALIWQGAFIDASKHWTGRGEGFQVPLGDNVLGLPAGPSFATLPDVATEWPRHKARDRGDRFKGYRLAGGGRPVFQYDIGPAHVEDFPEGVSGGESPTIRRTLELSADKPPRDLYFRAAVGKKIEALEDGWYGIDGEWKLRISAESKPFVRDSAGKSELILPVMLDGGNSRIVEEFMW